jgi:pyridoxamine 5'-phosphate oxidase
MNQKNSLGLDNCFKDLENPIELFNEWFNEAKKTEINDPNALALATSSKDGVPSVRIVLLKGFNQNGFVVYTNLDSKKSIDIKNNPNAAMCFHWKSLLRQIRITGEIFKVSDEDADLYFKSRDYESRIGAWASKQSSVLKNREELYQEIENYKKKYSDKNKVPRPSYWSGWNLKPNEIEFWLDGKNRIHQRLKYIKSQNGIWNRSLLSP